MTPTTILDIRPVAVAVDTRNVAYQELKSRIHQELLNRLNLDRLTRVRREDAEPEIRSLINGILERERDKTPLSLYERENIVSDVLHELFGLGPLEMLLQDPSISDILVNRFDQVYVERNGRLESTDVTFSRLSSASSAASGAASTNPARWWMPGCQMDPVSTRSSRRWRSTAACCPSAGSERTNWAPTISWAANPGRSR